MLNLKLSQLAAVILSTCLATAALGATDVQGEPTPDSKSFRIYVTNEASGDLSVIEGDTKAVVETIPLSMRARGVKAGPSNEYLFIALSGSSAYPSGAGRTALPSSPSLSPPRDGIGMVNLRTGKVEKIIRGVPDPEQLAVSEDGEQLYVANKDTSTAVVSDVESGQVIASLPVGSESQSVTISPNGDVVYITSSEDHQVSVIETKTNMVLKQFDVGRRPRCSAFSPNGSRAYVTSESEASITVVDTTDHTVVATIALPDKSLEPTGVVVSPHGDRLYVTTGHGGTVAAIDTASHELLGQVKVGKRPAGLAISPDGSELYSADGPSNTVSVVDAHSLELKQQIDVGHNPWGIIVLPQ